MKEKLKTCPVCGKEMAAGAKACPSCGAKNKKPIYRRWWFWVLVDVYKRQTRIWARCCAF